MTDEIVWPRDLTPFERIARMLDDWKLTNVAMPDEVRVAPDVWREIEESTRYPAVGQRIYAVHGVRVVPEQHAPAGMIWTHCYPKKPKSPP